MMEGEGGRGRDLVMLGAIGGVGVFINNCTG